MLKLVALSLLLCTISAQELGADDILEDITSGAEEEWGAPAPAPAPAAAPGEAPVPAHKGGWKSLANKTTGWWGKHAKASAPASDGKKHGAGWWGKHAKAPAAAPAKAPKRRSRGYGKRRRGCPRCRCRRRRPFSWGRVSRSSRKLYGKRRGSGSGSGSGKKKFSWGSIKARGKSWLNKAKTKGKSWLTKGKSWLNKAKTKGKSWLNKAKKGSGKSLYGKRRGSGSGSTGSGFKRRPGGIAWTIPSSSGSGSGGSGFKKRKGGIAWTIPSSSGSGSGGSGVGGVIKKRKGGMAWTIPKDDEEEELEDDVEEQQ